MPKIHHHEPKFYIRLCNGKPTVFPENFKVYSGSIYGRFQDNTGNRIFWVCDSYCFINGKLPIHIYSNKSKEWKLCMTSPEHPCYKWVKSAILSLGYVPKVQNNSMSFKDYENLMKTYSTHKKGSGCRINTHQINAPLKWNEITEIAHWYGKGNASVVANNIR